MPRPLRRLSIPVQLADELETLAATYGGVSKALDALIAQAIGRTSSLEPLEQGSITKYTHPSSRGLLPNKGEPIEIRLTTADIGRLEAEAAKDHFTKAQWIVALVRSRLHYRREYNRWDNVRLKTVCRDLADIVSKLGKVTRSIQLQEIAGNAHSIRLDEIPALTDRIKKTLDDLQAVDEHNNAYWTVVNAPKSEA